MCVHWVYKLFRAQNVNLIYICAKDCMYSAHTKQVPINYASTFVHNVGLTSVCRCYVCESHICEHRGHKVLAPHIHTDLHGHVAARSTCILVRVRAQHTQVCLCLFIHLCAAALASRPLPLLYSAGEGAGAPLRISSPGTEVLPLSPGL